MKRTVLILLISFALVVGYFAGKESIELSNTSYGVHEAVYERSIP